MPKISVYTVFSNYNEEWLEEAVESLLAQTFCDIEYIFVEYAKDSVIPDFLGDYFYPFETTLVNCAQQLTFIEAIKVAISECSTDYVMRLDADDVLEPDILGYYAGIIEKSKPDIVIPDWKDIAGKIHPGSDLNLPAQSLIRKDIYKHVDFFQGQKHRDGTSLIATAKKHGYEISYLPEVGFYYREHTDSLSANKKKNIAVDASILGHIQGVSA